MAAAYLEPIPTLTGKDAKSFIDRAQQNVTNKATISARELKIVKEIFQYSGYKK